MGLTLGAGVLTSCADDDIRLEKDNASRAGTYENITFDKDAGLIPQEDGTWVATRRVPLVGDCRIVDQIMKSLVTVGSYNDNTNKVTDTDLTNTAMMQSDGVGADVAYQPIISLRDLNYIYAGGQKAGFVVRQRNSGVLSLDVLDGMTITTYYLGKKQEEKAVNTSSGLLALGLGNITDKSDGLIDALNLEAEFSKKFDEVRLGCTGVTANALKSGLEVYYAYVGETEAVPVIKSTFPNCYTKTGSGDTSDPASEYKLIDENLDNGPGFAIVKGGSWNVYFGEVAEAGSEIGFYVEEGAALELGVAATNLIETLDENGNTIEKISSTDVVGLDLASGGSMHYSLITSKPCYGAKLTFAGVKVCVGGGTVHYCYVRKPTIVDSSSYFSLTNATTYMPNYRLPLVDKGSVTYEVVSYPAGANPDIQNGALVKMTVPGNYVVKGTWVDEAGNPHVQYATITRRVRNNESCNYPIIKSNYEGYKLEVYRPKGDGSLLRIPIDSESGGSNIIDDELDNYFEVNKALDVDLAGVRPVIGVCSLDSVSENGSLGKAFNEDIDSDVRVGFVINDNSSVVGADVLNFLRITLIDKAGNKLEKVADGGVNVSLVREQGKNPKVRISVTVPKNFKFSAIELHSIKVLSADIASNMKVYYAFMDRNIDYDCPDPGQECMELVNAANYRAKATIQGGGGITAGLVVENIGNMLDGRIDSYATVAVPLSVIQDFVIATTFDPIKAGTPVGFILRNRIELAKVATGFVLTVHYADGSTTSTADGGVANVNLGVDEYTYIYANTDPTKGDIVGLDMTFGSGVAVSGCNICGIFSRSDADSNGIADCLEDQLNKTDYEPVLILEKTDYCASDNFEIRVDGADDIKYTLEVAGDDSVTNFSVEMNDDGYLTAVKGAIDFVTFFNNPDNAGIYQLRLRGGNVDSELVTVKLHPEKTTWTGKAGNTDWKDWENWDNGEPWECTKVIMPTPEKLKAVGGQYYPVLVKGGKYRCEDIHFENGALLKGQQFLNYSGIVYADVTLTTGDYHLMSSPIQNTVTGDMFVNADWNLNGAFGDNGKWNYETTFTKYFTKLNEESYPEKRVSPTIYQRFWDDKIPAIVTMSRGLMDDDLFKNWTRSFNAVNERYDAYQGYAMCIGRKGESLAESYTLHFPKTHTEYWYFDAFGNKLKKADPIARINTSGRFWTDNYKGSETRSVKLGRLTDGVEYLMGNLFMSYIDVKKLMARNGNIQSVYCYVNGKYEKMGEGTAYPYIAPFQSVFLISNSEPARQLEIELNYYDLTNAPAE